MATKKTRYRIGQIVAIPLTDERFAYAKIFKEGGLGIFDLVSDNLLAVEQVINHHFSFYVTCTDVAIKDGRWPIVGEYPFESEDDSWIPPQAIFYSKDTKKWTMGSPYISHKGGEFKCELERAKGLDIASVVVHPDSLVRLIIDRVINKNHEKYQVPR